MHLICLFLFTISALSAAPQAVLELSRKGPMLIRKDVYLNHRGPFRMMIDTGSASSLISSEVAHRIGLRPTYAVEQDTVAGITRVGATVLDEVTTGVVTQKGVEVIILPNVLHDFDGVLGQSWLAAHDYLLDYRRRRLLIDPEPPVTGVKLALRGSEGRPSVAARVSGRDTELVLDSGAETLVLFGAAVRFPSATLFTTNGQTAVGESQASVVLGSAPARSMRALHVRGPERPGLLPLATFSSVYVSNRSGQVVLQP